MPTFTGTQREFKIIIDSLSMPVGVTKADRGAAESLRDRLKHIISIDNAPPKVGSTYSPLRSNWPSMVAKSSKKQDNWFHKPHVAPAVHLNNSTTQEKIDDILKGLI